MLSLNTNILFFPVTLRRWHWSLPLKELRLKGGGRGGGGARSYQQVKLSYLPDANKQSCIYTHRTPLPSFLPSARQKAALQAPKWLPFSMLYIPCPCHFLRNPKHHSCFSSLFLSLDYSDSPSQYFLPQGFFKQLKSLPLTTQIKRVDV